MGKLCCSGGGGATVDALRLQGRRKGLQHGIAATMRAHAKKVTSSLIIRYCAIATLTLRMHEISMLTTTATITAIEDIEAPGPCSFTNFTHSTYAYERLAACLSMPEHDTYVAKIGKQVKPCPQKILERSSTSRAHITQR